MVGAILNFPASFAGEMSDQLLLVEVEFILSGDSVQSHLLLILHGRRICKPKPLCAECGIKEMCDYYINSAGGKN